MKTVKGLVPIAVIVILVFGITLYMTFGTPRRIDSAPSHKIVYQLSESDSLSQIAMVEMIKNIKREWPAAEIEVVCQGSGVFFLTTNKTFVADAIARMGEEGVVFAACNNSMKKRSLTMDELVPEAIVVPSALVELAAKQEGGWSYLH